MSFLLFAVTALHVLVLVLLFVATLDKAWWVLPDEETVNLWYDCVLQNSTRSWVCASVADSPWLRAVQGLMVAALLLSSAAFALFVWQLHTGPRGRLFSASGGTQLLAAPAAALLPASPHPTGATTQLLVSPMVSVWPVMSSIGPTWLMASLMVST
ncbi:epithelial membrane protein 3 isoform X2 [Falco biarmicus]|uniref:epithelial membrane protein 3 isoform X2 n=1 Tax=Falco biarmicus TaxID=345155 RepID=UPI0024BD44D2|nr:epithelial membrane protein 3 isoform X2 [Falco biarmicus]